MICDLKMADRSEENAGTCFGLLGDCSADTSSEDEDESPSRDESTTDDSKEKANSNDISLPSSTGDFNFQDGVDNSCIAGNAERMSPHNGSYSRMNASRMLNESITVGMAGRYQPDGLLAEIADIKKDIVAEKRLWRSAYSDEETEWEGEVLKKPKQRKLFVKRRNDYDQQASGEGWKRLKKASDHKRKHNPERYTKCSWRSFPVKE